MLSIETGRKKSYRSSTFQKLDKVLEWPVGHSEEKFKEAAAQGIHRVNSTAGRNRVADLRRAYRELRDAGASPEATASAAELLAYALVPTVLVKLQSLQLDDLYGFDSDEILELDEILNSHAAADTAESDANGFTDGVDQPANDDRASRTVARLPDGRTVAIKALRIERGLSQDDVAKAITRLRRARDPQAKAASVPTISGIESGYRGASSTLTRELESVYQLKRGAITKQW